MGLCYGSDCTQKPTLKVPRWLGFVGRQKFPGFYLVPTRREEDLYLLYGCVGQETTFIQCAGGGSLGGQRQIAQIITLFLRL